jgi:hypothetical protein
MDYSPPSKRAKKSNKAKETFERYGKHTQKHVRAAERHQEMASQKRQTILNERRNSK